MNKSLIDWVNYNDIEIHKKYINESFDNNKLENGSLINNMNSLTIGNSKNNISIEENDKKVKEEDENEIIKVKKKEKGKEKRKENKEKDKLNYYDEVIDEILLDRNDNENRNIENMENGKKDNKKKKHGQCCTIL